MDEREILEQAYTSIQNMDYRNARRMLLRIPSHPTAAKWLTKIDTILSQQSPVLTTSKPLPDIDMPRRTPRRKPQSTPVLLYSLMAGVGVIVVLVVVALNTFSDYFNPPGSFHDERISLSYGEGWVPQSLGNHHWCYAIGIECLYYMTTRPDIGLLVAQVDLPQPYTAFEFGESLWQTNENDSTFVERDLDFDEFNLAGLPAVAYMYYQVRAEENSSEYYVADIYVTDGTHGYIINLASYSPCNLKSKIEAVNAVLSTLRIASDAAWVEEDGYTETSTVKLTVWACD